MVRGVSGALIGVSDLQSYRETWTAAETVPGVVSPVFGQVWKCKDLRYFTVTTAFENITAFNHNFLMELFKRYFLSNITSERKERGSY